MATTAKPMNLTDAEIDWIARGLAHLAEIPDWKRRIDLAALVVKIGIIEDSGIYAVVQHASGIKPKAS